MKVGDTVIVNRCVPHRHCLTCDARSCGFSGKKNNKAKIRSIAMETHHNHPHAVVWGCSFLLDLNLCEDPWSGHIVRMKSA